MSIGCVSERRYAKHVVSYSDVGKIGMTSKQLDNILIELNLS